MITKLYDYFLIFSLLFLSACSPQLNKSASKPVEKIHIKTDYDVKVVLIDGKDPVQFPVKRIHSLKPGQFIKAKPLSKKRRSQKYFVGRNNKPLAVTLDIYDKKKTVYLQPHKTYGWFFNAHCYCGLKDSLNSRTAKCWSYSQRNVIDFNDTGISVSRFAPVNKGTVIPTFSEGIATLNLKRDYGHRNSASVITPELAIDYFYGKNRFLSFILGAATDLVPLPIDYFGPGYIERGSIVYTSVRNNIVMGSFDAGYGISLSRLYWSKIPINDTVHQEIKVRTNGLGLSFSAHYKITKNLRAGILYQPNLINLKFSPVFSYQHYLSVHCIWYFHDRR